MPGTHDSLAQQWIIYLDGQFDSGAMARLASLIALLGISQAWVYLNSPGGSLIEGMTIGYLTAMGIDSEMFQMMARVSPNGIRLPTREEALQLRLVNDGEVRSGAHP